MWSESITNLEGIANKDQDTTKKYIEIDTYMADDSLIENNRPAANLFS